MKNSFDTIINGKHMQIEASVKELLKDINCLNIYSNKKPVSFLKQVF